MSTASVVSTRHGELARSTAWADPDVSDRCRRLAHNTRILTRTGVETVFAPVVSAVRLSRFRRMMESDRRTPWSHQAVALAASVAARVLGQREDELRRYLYGDRSAKAVTFFDQLVYAELWRDNERNLLRLKHRVQDAMLDARRVLSCSRVLPFSMMEEPAIEAVINAEQEDVGFDSRQRRAKLKYAQAAREFRLNHFDPKQQVVLGVTQTSYQQLLTCTGPYRHLADGGQYETLDSIREDMVVDRGIHLRFIDDVSDRMPSHLHRWMDKLMGVVAVDDQFLMKVTRSRVRIILERNGNVQNDAIIDSEIANLQAILNFSTHDPDPKTVLRLLEGVSVNHRKKTAEEIRAANLRQLKLTSPEPVYLDRAPVRVGLSAMG